MPENLIERNAQAFELIPADYAFDLCADHIYAD